MLKTLRRIVQEVSAAATLAEALQLMVRRVKAAFDTQACTIYLADQRKTQYVLMATDGLNPKAVGKIRIDPGQGLIGLVAKREEPINLENAPEHPKFYFHKAAGEENYRAFLGVPIIHHKKVLGVLTVQQTEERRFDEAEEAFLVTISAQLAGVLAHAEATGKLCELHDIAYDKTKTEDTAISGIPSVPGVGIGTAVVVYPLADLNAVPNRRITDVKAEVKLFNQALIDTRAEMTDLSERLVNSLPPEEHALFDVYLHMLDKAALGAEVNEVIRQGFGAQTALRKVIKKHVNQFEAMEDEYLRERAVDFRDIGRRVLSHLQASQAATIDYPADTILVGDEVTASALAEVPEGCLVGVVSGQGSRNSHVAILARALGVPTVMGAQGIDVGQLAEKHLIVDGYHGNVYLNPSQKLLKQFQILAKEEQELTASLQALREQSGETPDGHRVSLYVNTGLIADSGLSLSVGAEGVGLYRSEMPFMTRDRFPAEEEQRVIYRQLLKAFAPRPVALRTLDIGGDKALPYFPVDEKNPFLGWRGIRVTLDHPEVFLMQLRAMLRANVGLNNMRILLPMISSVSEVDEAYELINQAFQEVSEEDPNIQMPLVGVMVEVPSAVYQARSLAKRVDFLSVGSNDLIQYLLAVDRNNSRVADLYQSLHPAVLRALLQVVEGGHSEGKRVGICGEMASDPAAVILLLAMDFDVLSMNSASLPRVKWVIRNFTITRARKLLGEVLELDNPVDIRLHLEKAIDAAGLGGLIRAGKK